MRATQHFSNNAVLGAPAGTDQREQPCNALAITRTEWQGMNAVVSFWKPTEKELKLLNSGAFVSLWVLGNNMPPVAVEVSE